MHPFSEYIMRWKSFEKNNSKFDEKNKIKIKKRVKSIKNINSKKLNKNKIKIFEKNKI